MPSYIQQYIMCTQLQRAWLETPSECAIILRFKKKCQKFEFFENRFGWLKSQGYQKYKQVSWLFMGVQNNMLCEL